MAKLAKLFHATSVEGQLWAELLNESPTKPVLTHLIDSYKNVNFDELKQISSSMVSYIEA